MKKKKIEFSIIALSLFHASVYSMEVTRLKEIETEKQPERQPIDTQRTEPQHMPHREGQEASSTHPASLTPKVKPHLDDQGTDAKQEVRIQEPLVETLDSAQKQALEEQPKDFTTVSLEKMPQTHHLLEEEKVDLLRQLNSDFLRLNDNFKTASNEEKKKIVEEKKIIARIKLDILEAENNAELAKIKRKIQGAKESEGLVLDPTLPDEITNPLQLPFDEQVPILRKKITHYLDSSLITSIKEEQRANRSVLINFFAKPNTLTPENIKAFQGIYDKLLLWDGVRKFSPEEQQEIEQFLKSSINSYCSRA